METAPFRHYHEAMSTRAESFRYFEERSGPKKPKREPRPRRDFPVNTALPGVSATDRKAGFGGTLRRGPLKRDAKNVPYALEAAVTGKTSRRSTRKSTNRGKPSHPLRSAKQNARMRAARLP